MFTPGVLMDYLVAIPRDGSRMAKYGTAEDFVANGITAEDYDVYPSEPAGPAVASPEHLVRRLLIDKPSATRFELIKQVREQYGHSLYDAKRVVDEVLADRS